MRFTIAILLTITARVANAQISPVNLSQTTDAQKGTFSIEADATIQDLLAKKTEGKPSSGSLGFVHVGSTLRERFAAYITVAGVDTLRGRSPEQFARALLSPGGQGSAISMLSGDYQRHYRYGKQDQKFGPRLYFSASQSTWSHVGDSDTLSAAMPLLSGGARVFWMPINFRKDENHISLTAEAGYAIRSLRGSGENAKAMIERALGNPQTTYYGPEFMVTIQVRQVSAFWVSNVMNAKDKSKVDGLTGYQQRFGFSIDAPLITF